MTNIWKRTSRASISKLIPRGLCSVRPGNSDALTRRALSQELSKPTVKQHLAALRMLFDWLVVGHIMAVNPAHAVRGPKHSVRKDKTPVLTAEEARTLLDSIPVMRTVKLKGGEKKEVHCVVGLRDRALIGLMVFTFARVGAAIGMKV